MRLLLDTHTLLWFYLGDAQLSVTARGLLEDRANIKFVSPASYWELAIKVSLGKYQLTEPYAEFIQHALFDNGFLILPVEPRHTALLAALPFPPDHKDPFDRLIVAQATVENLPVISCDTKLDSYSIRRLW